VIKRLRLRNFKGIREGEIELAPLTIMLGGNNSGKTTVLEALFLAPNPFRKVPYNTGEEAIRVLQELHTTLDSMNYEFIFHNYITEEAVIQCDDYLLRFIKDRNTIYVATNREDIRHQKIAIKGQNILMIGTLPLGGLGFSSIFEGTAIENTLLFGSELTRMSYEYLRRNWSHVVNRKISEKVVKDVSQLIHEKYADMTIEPLFGGGVAVNVLLADGRRIRLGDMGAGTQSYVTAKILYELEKPKILLWDDVEAHFNPRMLSSIAAWFSGLLDEDVQIIVTTHSLEAAKIIAAMAEEKATIYLNSLEDNILKVKRLKLKEVEEMAEAGIDVRVAEPFLL